MDRRRQAYLNGMRTRAHALEITILERGPDDELEGEERRLQARDKQHLDNLLFLIRTYDKET